MSDYKVSALKYRPQKFAEVISQEFVTQTLINAIVNNKIAHSYLLSGPRGTGKTTIARILAKALNCPNSIKGEPCNNCKSCGQPENICEACEEITKSIHPDIFELDAASNRGIDDVRAIQDAAKYAPLKAKYKFFIVDEVHMLTIQAFNAMLKILEEPPPYLIFVLATTNPEKLPKTILSRCQRFALHKLKIAEISGMLEIIAKNEKITIDAESVFLISKLGDGALRDALGIFDMAVSYCGNNINHKELKDFLNLPDKEMYFTLSSYIYEGNAKDLLNFINDLKEQGMDLQTFFNGIIEHLRNLLILKTTGKIELLDESDFIKNKYKEQTEKFSEEQISRLLKLMFDNEARFKFSSNQSILLESILAEMSRINKEVVDLSNLISDLENIKKKTNNLTINSETLQNKEIKTESSIEKTLKDLFNTEEYKIE